MVSKQDSKAVAGTELASRKTSESSVLMNTVGDSFLDQLPTEMKLNCDTEALTRVQEHPQYKNDLSEGDQEAVKFACFFHRTGKGAENP